MNLKIVLKKGLDININGCIADEVMHSVNPVTVAIFPDDFPGFLPKLDVKEGDNVKIGSPVMRDKAMEQLKLVSPVCGRVAKIVRGERRKIECVIIESETRGEADTIIHDVSRASSREDIVGLLAVSGLLAMMRSRPYDVVPKVDVFPRDIFVTGFDSAPLAPDFDILIDEFDRSLLCKGLETLAQLTDGSVYVGMRNGKIYDCKASNVRFVEVSGPHPAGNAGVQAANIAPVNKGDTVWTTDLMTVCRIGALMTKGVLPMEAIVAVTGSEVVAPRYVKTVIGSSADCLLAGNLKEDGRNKRIISGNVLTGVKIAADGYLRYPYRHITVIPEGDDVDEFMGWAAIGCNKMSVSRSFLSSFLPRKKFSPDARLHGGRRAIIMSGEYDKVLPMDIMAEYLFKAIMSRNIEDMENLGIYEISPEDVALCEYVDTSKLEIQKLVREGLDYLRNELE